MNRNIPSTPGAPEADSAPSVAPGSKATSPDQAPGAGDSAATPGKRPSTPAPGSKPLPRHVPKARAKMAADTPPDTPEAAAEAQPQQEVPEPEAPLEPLPEPAPEPAEPPRYPPIAPQMATRWADLVAGASPAAPADHTAAIGTEQGRFMAEIDAGIAASEREWDAGIRRLRGDNGRYGGRPVPLAAIQKAERSREPSPDSSWVAHERGWVRPGVLRG